MTGKKPFKHLRKWRTEEYLTFLSIISRHTYLQVQVLNFKTWSYHFKKSFAWHPFLLSHEWPHKLAFLGVGETLCTTPSVKGFEKTSKLLKKESWLSALEELVSFYLIYIISRGGDYYCRIEIIIDVLTMFLFKSDN